MDGPVRVRLLEDGKLEVIFPEPDVLEMWVWFRNRDLVDAGGVKNKVSERKMWRRGNGSTPRESKLVFTSGAVQSKGDARCDIWLPDMCECTQLLPCILGLTTRAAAYRRARGWAFTGVHHRPDVSFSLR